MATRRAARSSGDPIFAAEMVAIATARREAFLAHRGDGMAVPAPSWMNFDYTAPRVPPPRPAEAWFDVTKYSTPLHAHSLDSACLEPVDEVPFVTAGGTRMVRQPGWLKCREIGNVYLHDHGGRLMGHAIYDRTCPVPMPG